MSGNGTCTMIRKADIILAAIILAAGILSSVLLIYGGGAGAAVRITVDGTEYGTYDLDTDRIIQVESNGHFNTVEIKDGQVSIIDADCPDRLCIRQGWISRTSQSIVCLPNKVVIELTGPQDDGPDSYSS